MADVPTKYDITFNNGSSTYGYVLYTPYTGGDSANAPQKAIHSYSPTFVPRQNVQGNYGDQEEFFLTFSQKDWSLGEQQKYQARGQDTRRFWLGTNVDVTKGGEVSLRRQTRGVTSVGNAYSIASKSIATMWAATSSNLWTVDAEGAGTDHGAHGLGATPGAPHGVAGDATDAYITAASTALVRKWNGSAFSTFSTSDATVLAYHGNALYGYAAGNLYRWSTAGTRSTLFTWQDVDGTAQNFSETDVQLVSFGGKLLINICLSGGLAGSTWIYDGVGVSKIIDHPNNFASRSVCILNGIVFLGGSLQRYSGSSSQMKPAVMFYANGSTGFIWQADSYITEASDLNGSKVAAYENGVLFTDDTLDKLMWYDAANGGVQSVGSYTTDGTGSQRKMISVGNFAAISSSNGSTISQFPHNSSFATTGTITTSLIDFDSSLTKLFRGIKIDYEEGSDGDGGSVDVAYQLNEVDGAFTTLQTGVTSGTEYTLGTAGTEVTGQSISVKVTLNKGSSTYGPVLKRIYVRASPKRPQYHRVLVHLDCSGTSVNPMTDNSGSPIPRTGSAMVAELRALADSDTLLTVTDSEDTFTGVIESLEMTQIRRGPEPGYIATVVAREV